MLSSPPLSGLAIRGMLYTHNPFYLLSALLVLIGLHKALAGDSSLAGGWLLMGTLCGYTLLLVVAGYVIVRFGQVWEDARMILLVIVLLFLALSVSFDRITLVRPLNGAGFLLGGWCFAVLVSEAVFRSLGIRLAASYRVPYYLVLALTVCLSGWTGGTVGRRARRGDVLGRVFVSRGGCGRALDAGAGRAASRAGRTAQRHALALALVSLDAVLLLAAGGRAADLLAQHGVRSG